MHIYRRFPPCASAFKWGQRSELGHAPADEVHEVVEQLLAAEELLTWEALEPSWGAMRHDWVRSVQHVDQPPDLAEPLRVFEDALQQWAVGKMWAQRRTDWIRRLERVRQETCIDPEGELTGEPPPDAASRDFCAALHSHSAARARHGSAHRSHIPQVSGTAQSRWHRTIPPTHPSPQLSSAVFSRQSSQLSAAK